VEPSYRFPPQRYRRHRARLAFLTGRARTTTTTSTIRKNSAAFFIVLVLVVVLDCFPLPADRGRRPRARSGKIPPLPYRPRPRRRARLLSSAGGSRTTTIRSTIRKILRLFFRARPRRRARLLSSPGRTRTTTTTITIRKNPPLSLSSSSSSSCPIAFLGGRIEDDDD
jgi:hypothetical protein